MKKARLHVPWRRFGVAVAIVGGVATFAGTELATGSSAAPVAHLAGACGTIPNQPPVTQPAGLLNFLPASVRANYNGTPSEDVVETSPWSTFKGDKKPWKIGISGGFPILNSQMSDSVAEMQREFAIAKKEGLVTGSLIVNIPPSASTTTPADQVASLHTMIAEGVKGILVFPGSAPALAPVVTAAAKQGVVMLPDVQAFPQSKYAVGMILQSYIAQTQGVIKAMGGKGNVLIVRGIPGVQEDSDTYATFTKQIAQCPNIHIAGVVVGQYDNADTKTVVQQWLASHPEPIAGVFEAGEMGPGVIRAFVAAGRTVPPIALVSSDGAVGGYWLAHPSYNGTASGSNGEQEVYSMFHVMLRILNGNELKINDIVAPAVVITKNNIKQFAVPGSTINTTSELKGPLDGWMSDSYLDNFFVKKGQPGGNIGY
jgi:ribose transport system substrate-binding protein